MFRVIVTKFPKSKLSGRYHVTCLKYHKSASRHAKDKADLCPPEPGKSSGSGFVYTLGALALVGGATLGYAKYDPDFREWLTEQAPFTDDMIKVIFQEDSSLYDGALKALDGLRESIMNLFMGEDSEEGKTKRQAIRDKAVDYKPPNPAFNVVVKNTKPTEESYTEIRLETKNEDAKEPTVEIVGIPKETDVTLPPLHPKNIADLELKIGETAALAIKGYNKAVTALKRYNQEIGVFVDDSVGQVDKAVWDSLKKLTSEKNTTLKEAEKLSKEVTKKISELKSLLDDPHLEAPVCAKEQSRLNIDKLQQDIFKAKRELDAEKRQANVTDKYWHKVEEGRSMFSEELEILFPKVNIKEKKLNIDEGDLDLFVLHAVSKVLYYQKELAKLETEASDRLKAALESAKRSGCEMLTHEQICQELEKQKRLLEDDYNKKCLKLRVESEKDLRQQLKLQSQAFQDHLADAIKVRELEIERRFGRNFDEKLMAERCKFKEQVAAMVGRLRGMDQAMKARADADKTAQQSQVLWSACQALYRSIRAGCPGLPWMEQLRPLEPEIAAVSKAAAEGDELVQVVVAGIPAEAKNRGVYPEDALRERFIKVEKVARSLALVPENGARLHMYMLSYLQSLLLLKAANPIPQAELNDEKVDFSKLSTNEILQRAKYYLDRGDFAQTLRYMNLLKGAPRAVARQWMEETRILLETQQAANILMAHASASGLMYL